MNLTSNLKNLWLLCASLALALVISQWFGYEVEGLADTVLSLNAMMFILSVPCSLFFVPVAWAANYYLDINALSVNGIYLNTVFLFVLGLMQWFWVSRFWYPTEAPFQTFELIRD